MVEKFRKKEGKYSTGSINKSRRTEIEVLVALERWKDAYELLQKQSLSNDTVRSLEYAKQIDELSTQYEVDRHIAEKKRERELRKTQLIWFLVAFSLLSLLLTVYIRYSHKLKLKNRRLYNQIQENLEREKKVKKLTEITPKEEDTISNELFDKLVKLLNKDLLFTKIDLDRRSLAERLSTNERYLTQAIQDGGEHSLSSYLSKLRLQYALEVLNNQPDINLEELALKSGHGSYSAFFRSFSRHYGISPSEFRKLRMEKQ